MAILVTGGAGFIGSCFVRDWIAASAEPVVTLDKLSYSGNAGNLAPVDGRAGFAFARGDIGDPVLVGELLRSYQVRAVVNFAAETHVDRSIASPEVFVETNIVGTYRLLEAARSYWQELAQRERQAFRFLHVSTDEVYGSLDGVAAGFDEVHRFAPNSPYAASKAASDHLVRAWHRTYGLPVLTTNCSNNYGPYQFPEKLIPLMILNALAGKSLPIYGDGLHVRDWLYVSDHCSAVRCVLAAGIPGEVYNIGGQCESTNLALVNELCALLDELSPRTGGQSYRSQITFVADRPGHDRRYAINADKIAHSLGWKPTETLASGLRKTAAWYLANQAWLESVASGAYRNWIAQQYGHHA